MVPFTRDANTRAAGVMANPRFCFSPTNSACAAIESAQVVTDKKKRTGEITAEECNHITKKHKALLAEGVTHLTIDAGLANEQHTK